MAENENPQAEADTQDQSEASTDAATEAGVMGSPEQPTPEEQNANPEDEANAAKADEQARAAGGQTPEGQPQSNAAPEQAPIVAGQPKLSPEQEAAQQQQQAAIQQFNQQRAAEIEQHDHQMGLFKRAGQFLAGGPSVSYRMDPETGELKKTARPLTGGQIAMGIVASVLGGMGDAKGARNPVEAIGQGFNAGAAQYKQQDQAKQQAAKEDYDRGVQAVFTNFKTLQTKNAAMKLGWDAKQDIINLNAPLHKALLKLQNSGQFSKKIIEKYMTGSDYQDAMAKDPHFLDKYVSIPVDQEWDIDPKTQGPHTNHHGDPAINTTYALINKDALVEVPKGLLEDGNGHKITYPEGTKLRAQMLVDNLNDQETNLILEHANAQFGEGAKEKDTKSDRAKAKAEAKTGEVESTSDTTASDEKASVWKRYTSVDALADVMSKNEGQAPGSRAQRNNNPGNIKGKGDKGTDKDGFAIYSTPEVGKKAQVDLLKNIQAKYPNLTAQELINGGKGYAGYSSTKDPGNSQASVDSYVAAINKGATGATAAGAPATAAATTEPTGLKFATPSNAEARALPASAKDAFKNLGGTWDDFINNGADAVKSKRISGADYDALANVLHSADGKLKGKAALAQNAEMIKTANAVAKKVADTKATEEAKRSFTDPEVQAAADALRQSGSLTTLKDIGGMAGGLRLRILTQAQKDAKAAGEKFDVGLINERVKFIGQYENPNGSSYKNRTAINNMMQHGADLVDINNEYRRTNMQVLNTPINAIKKQFGDATLVRYKTTLDVLKGEARLFFAGGYAPTADQEKMWNNIISDNATPAQVESFAKEITNLGMRRANTFDSEYKKVMGHRDPDMIVPEAREAAQKMAGNDPAGVELKKNLDKFASGGEYGSDAGFKPGELPKGNGQKLNPSDPASKNVFESYMKAAGDDPVKAKQMMQQGGWVF